MIAPVIEPNLDIEVPGALTAYLRAAGRIGPDQTPQCTVLAGGVSNRTVHVTRAGGPDWVVKQALAKLRVAVDWFSDPARIAREAQGLRHLQRLAPPGTITPLIFEDPRYHLLAMEAVPQPHDNWKTLLLAGDLQMAHVEQFATLLAAVHRAASGDAAIAETFADRSYFDTLRLEPYYRYAAANVPPAAPFIDALIDTTWSRRLTLVHGDYSPKNILVRQGRLILLDHEVIHYGDPAFDLGFSLAHLLSKAHKLPAHREAFASAAIRYFQRYRAALGDVPWADTLEPHAVRHALACLLARVAGRSTLEYLDAAQRRRQEDAIVVILGDPPSRLDDLVARFTAELDSPRRD